MSNVQAVSSPTLTQSGRRGCMSQTEACLGCAAKAPSPMARLAPNSFHILKVTREHGIERRHGQNQSRPPAMITASPSST